MKLLADVDAFRKDGECPRCSGQSVDEQESQRDACRLSMLEMVAGAPEETPARKGGGHCLSRGQRAASSRDDGRRPGRRRRTRLCSGSARADAFEWDGRYENEYEGKEPEHEVLVLNAVPQPTADGH